MSFGIPNYDFLNPTRVGSRVFLPGEFRKKNILKIIFLYMMPFLFYFLLFVDLGSFYLCHAFSFFWFLERGHWFFSKYCISTKVSNFLCHLAIAFLVQDHFFGFVRRFWFHFLLFCKNRMLLPEVRKKWIIGRRIHVIFIFSLLLFVFLVQRGVGDILSDLVINILCHSRGLDFSRPKTVFLFSMFRRMSFLFSHYYFLFFWFRGLSAIFCLIW